MSKGGAAGGKKVRRMSKGGATGGKKSKWQNDSCTT